MYIFEGLFFDGKTAQSTPAIMSVNDDGWVSLQPDFNASTIHFNQLNIESRISGLPAKLVWPSGALFETRDFATLDQCLRQYSGMHKFMLHSLEKSRKIVFLSLLGLLVVGGSSLYWGVPLLGKFIAPRVPESVQLKLGNDVLEQLDNLVFKPSKLSAARQSELTAMFAQLSSSYQANAKLEFRQGGFVSANAMALPGGTIVITDELVAVAENNAQLSGVLLHELGHLVHRHSLRGIINQSSLAVTTLVIFGDISGIGAVLIATPSLFLQKAFSREMEEEADDYAVAEMKHLNIPPASFMEILNRLEIFHAKCRMKMKSVAVLGPVDGSPENDVGQKEMPADSALQDCLNTNGSEVDTIESEAADTRWFNYLSSHPTTPERIARLNNKISQ